MSMISLIRSCALLVLVAVSTLSAVEPTPHSPDHQRVTTHAETIGDIGDRSPGSEGAQKAANYIRSVLQPLTEEVWTQRTSLIVPIDHGSTLTAGKQTISLTPHAPNGIALSGTAGQDLSGVLHFIDGDSLDKSLDYEIDGSIIVLDGDSGDLWLRCAQYGAKAVIFTSPEKIDNRNMGLQALHASMVFPRFVANIDRSLDGQDVRLKSLVTYKTVQAETIVARLKGTAQTLEEDRRETVVLSSGYESEGSIRGLSHGATRAWNAALLLDLAQQYKDKPMDRDLLVVFHGARSEFFRGMRQTLAGLTDNTQRMVTNDVGQSVPMGDDLVDTWRKELWRSEEIKADFEEYLALIEGGLQPENAQTKLLELLGDLRNEPPELVTEINAEENTAAPLFSPGQWVILLAMALTVAAVFIWVKPDTQGTWATILAAVLILAWIIAERPQSSDALMEEELESESKRITELAERFISEESAVYADEIRPRLRDAAMRAVSGDRLGLSEQEVTEAQTLQKQLDEEHRLWRDLQQKIGKRQLDWGQEGTIEEVQQLPRLIKGILGQEGAENEGINRHQSILKDRIADLESTIQIRKDLGNYRLLHMIALDLSDGGDLWSAAFSGPWMRWAPRMSSFGYAIESITTDISEKDNQVTVPYDVEANKNPENLEAFWPKGYLHDAGVGSAFVNSVTLSTVYDARLRLGSPADRMDVFNSDRFLAQTSGLTQVIRQYASGSEINKPLQYRKGRWLSPAIRSEISSEGSTTGRKGFSYPMIQLYMGMDDSFHYGDVRYLQTHWGDATGEVVVPWLPNRMPKASGTITMAAVKHDSMGNIQQMIASKGTQMKGGGASEWSMSATLEDLKPMLFNAEASWLTGIHDPRLLMDLGNVQALSASRDSLPDFAHVQVDRGTAAIFVPTETSLRVLASEGQIGKRMALVGAPEDEKTLKKFVGIDNSGPISKLTALDAAQDLFNLNEGRLAELRANGVNSESLLYLHSQAERYLEIAKAELAQGNYVRAEGAAQAAWAMAGRVYPAVLATANDVVYGLVVMLIFAIPFAAICERLFYAGNTIFKRIGGFFAFFVLIFLFFFFFHPAFALATTPIIIFLAFAIIVMSSLVIVIIFNRFEQEMELIRMAGLGMHKVDVSRLGTLLATVTLGISNMRRRPLRTFLTAITVVLMSFILLTFASFNSSTSTRQISEDIPPAYQGIMLRQNGWLGFTDRSLERIENTWGDKFNVFERRWLDAATTNGRYTFTGPEGSSFVEAVIGVQPNDPTGIDQALQRPNGDVGLNDEEDWLYLPAESLFRAKLKPGDPIQFMGLSMRIGILDTEKLSGITHIDGDPITPLAPSPQSDEQRQEAQRMQAESASGEVAAESGSFIHLSPIVVGVAHVNSLKRLGAQVRSMALLPKNNQVDVVQNAEQMAQQLALSLRIGQGTDTKLMTAVGGLSVAGLSDVLIPLILGGMIIFSTMLGSVAERGKEIFIYASLGLAPLHIGALFLVEASIYAIIGGLGGYILAQFVVTGLGVAADLGFGVQPDLNYSSFTAVITILMVMATVLISALYPALVASKAANPGADTSFRVPEPDGDNLDIPFPFTVSGRDIMGLLAYLTNYLDAHTEASTGCFTAAEASMESTYDGYSVSAKTWLAPFDLGISQQFTITAQPTDVRAIYSIHISMHLLSGQRSAWRRVTIPFLRELRQQFLVWRTLDDETTDRYRALGGDTEAEARIAQRKQAADAEQAAILEEKERMKKAFSDKNAGLDSDENAEEGSK